MKYFPPFRFENSSGLLWREDQPVSITRKASQLLECLIDRAGVIVEHDRIMQCVWHDTHVQSDNIKVLVHELRTALADHAPDVEYIRTATGRRYMFVGTLTEAPVYRPSRRDGSFVGRDAELEDMASVLQRSISACEAGVYLLEGDRGMGKTMLCDALLYRARSQTSLRVLRGQAFESTTAVESDGALVDAIDLFAARHPDVALSPLTPPPPAWLDGVVNTFDSPIVTSFDGTPKMSPRLIRHLVGVLEGLARDLPLLLILEDVHLGDAITLECLRAIVRRPVGARLCVVVTFAREQHTPLIDELDRLGRELKLQHRGGSTKLSPLTARDVGECIAQRLGPAAMAGLAGAVYEATGGHPMLVASAIDALGAELGRVEPWTDHTTDRALSSLEAALSDGLQCQIDRLTSDDRILLETAAVTGAEFTASAVAAGLDCEHPGPIARRLEALAHRRVLIEIAAHAVSVPAGSPVPEHLYRFRQSVAADLLTAPLPLGRVTEVAARVRRSPSRRRRTDGPELPVRAAK